MTRNPNALEALKWEPSSVDMDERQLADQIVEDEKRSKESRVKNSRQDDAFELYAHDSHRWSPVTHYLEPYL